MKICEIGNNTKFNLLHKSYLWQKEISVITETELILFIEFSRVNSDNKVNAIKDVNTLMTLTGKQFKIFDDKNCISDLEFALSLMSRHRRSAVIMSLETRTDIDNNECLTWHDIIKIKMTPITKRMINNLPRHIATDCVFWENIGGMIMPIVGTKSFLKEELSFDWDYLQYAYDKTPINDKVDYSALKNSVIDDLLI